MTQPLLDYEVIDRDAAGAVQAAFHCRPDNPQAAICFMHYRADFNRGANAFRGGYIHHCFEFRRDEALALTVMFPHALVRKPGYSFMDGGYVCRLCYHRRMEWSRATYRDYRTRTDARYAAGIAAALGRFERGRAAEEAVLFLVDEPAEPPDHHWLHADQAAVQREVPGLREHWRLLPR